MDLSFDTLDTLLFLAPGFLGFRLYKIDSKWAEVRNIDIIYGSLIFSALGAVFYLFLLEFIDLDSPFWRTIFTFVAAIVFAIAWKQYGHRGMHGLLKQLGVTNEDNLGDVWQKIFNDPALYVTQITAHLRNGEAIKCSNTEKFKCERLEKGGIFPYYTHHSGQISFIPDLYRRSPKCDWQNLDEIEVFEVDEHPSDSSVRMVYLKPDDLQRLELRVRPVKTNAKK